MINIFCSRCVEIKNAQIRLSVIGEEVSVKCLECGDTKILKPSHNQSVKEN